MFLILPCDGVRYSGTFLAYLWEVSAWLSKVVVFVRLDKNVDYNGGQVANTISVQRWQHLILPRFFWLLFLLHASGVLVEHVVRVCLNLTLDDVIPEFLGRDSVPGPLLLLAVILLDIKEVKNVRVPELEINSKSIRPLVPTLVHITGRKGFLVRVSFFNCFVLCYFTWQCC